MSTQSNVKLTNTARKTGGQLAAVLAFMALPLVAIASQEIYVAVNDPNAADTAIAGRGSEELPYKTLQAAMGHAGLASNDTVWVKSGVYAEGGITYDDSTDTKNRVVIPNGVKLISKEGAALTTIKGESGMRCVYLGDAAEIRGFTLADGRTVTSGSGNANLGGGAFH